MACCLVAVFSWSSIYAIQTLWLQGPVAVPGGGKRLTLLAAPSAIAVRHYPATLLLEPWNLRSCRAWWCLLGRKTPGQSRRRSLHCLVDGRDTLRIASTALPPRHRIASGVQAVVALGGPADAGAELALLAAGAPVSPQQGAAAARVAEPGPGLAAAFSAAELRQLLDWERAAALLAMHQAEAAARTQAAGAN